MAWRSVCHSVCGPFSQMLCVFQMLQMLNGGSPGLSVCSDGVEEMDVPSDAGDPLRDHTLLQELFYKRSVSFSVGLTHIATFFKSTSVGRFSVMWFRERWFIWWFSISWFCVRWFSARSSNVWWFSTLVFTINCGWLDFFGCVRKCSCTGLAFSVGWQVN